MITKERLSTGISLCKKDMELATKQDIENMKQEILQEIRKRQETTSIDTPKYLKSTEVCDLFHISSTKLFELRRNGSIPCLKIGGQYLYDYNELVNKFKTLIR